MKQVLFVPKFLAAWITLVFSAAAVLYRLLGEKLNYIETDLLTLQKYTGSVSCIVAGDYSSLDENSHEEFLENFTEVYKRVEDYLSSPFVEKPYFAYMALTRARDALTRVQLSLRKNFIRKQPFGIIIGGPPGSGKTFGLQRLCCDLYKLDHDTCTMDDIVILNEGDEFQSEFQSHHKIVIFDDLGATNVKVVAQDPFRKIIDFINNVPKTALNPHLDLKGIVWIEPHIVGTTTNLQLPFIRQTHKNTDSVFCPGALNRRFKLKVWQYGFNEFYIVPPGDDFVYADDGTVTFMTESSKLDYEQLFEIAKDMYLEHNKEQEEFMELTTTLHAESASLEFSMIVAFQQALRLFIGKLGFTRLIPSSLLVLCRRFLAIPLQTLKSEQRSKLLAYLYSRGYSSKEIMPLISKLERLVRNGLSTSLLSLSRSERDVISSIITIAMPVMLKHIGHDVWYDLLYSTIPFVCGKIYSKVSESLSSDEEEEPNNWPFVSYLSAKFSTWREGYSIEKWKPSLPQRFSFNGVRETLLSYLPTKLHAEGKFEYAIEVIDVPFTEACLEECEVSPDDEFSLTIYLDGLEVRFKNITRCFTKVMKGHTMDYSYGITVTKDMFLDIRELYYEPRPLRAESKRSKKKAERKVLFDSDAIQMKYARRKDNLDFWPRQFPRENSSEIIEEYKRDKCGPTSVLIALGAMDGNLACYAPNFQFTSDYKFVRGRDSLFYLKHAKVMYFILREKHGVVNFDLELLRELFKDKCSMYAIICPQESVNRFILPLDESSVKDFEQDLTTLHRHLDVQRELYGSAFAKGTIFHYHVLSKKMYSGSVNVKETFLPLGVENSDDNEINQRLNISDNHICPIVKEIAKLKPNLLKLPEGFVGKWVARANYQYLNGIGVYRCRKCHHVWLSARTHKNYPQTCIECKTNLHACLFRFGEYTNPQSMDLSEKKEHIAKYCLACKAGDIMHLQPVLQADTSNKIKDDKISIDTQESTPSR
jgi:hypothetical protein